MFASYLLDRRVAGGWVDAVGRAELLCQRELGLVEVDRENPGRFPRFGGLQEKKKKQ